MREHRTKDGRLIRYMSRAELEGLRGYRAYASGRRGRAACPFHDGQSTTSLAIDWETGWASCWGCGKDAFAIRIEDHPDTHRPGDEIGPNRSLKRSTAPPRAESPKHDPNIVREGLAAMLTSWRLSLAGSPGAAYLEQRGIPLDVAIGLGIGWSTAGPLNRRVVFPLCGPDGVATSATGRAIDDRMMPKYKALAGTDGYVKTLFNGGAIAQARASGHPLVIVEGPIDAAACVAGGLPLTVAIGSTAYAHPEQFTGVTLALLVLDADDAGQQARRDFAAALMAAGVAILSLPAAALDGCKDLGEYWQARQTLPPALVARAIGPHPIAGTPHYSAFSHAPARANVNFCEWPDPGGTSENHQKTSDLRACVRVDYQCSSALPVIEAGAEPPQNATFSGAGVTAPATPGIDPFIADVIERSQRRDAEAARARGMTFADLPADLRTEAEALAADLIADPDPEALVRFWIDLERNRDLLAEDVIAARYALDRAVAALPDPDDIEAA